MKILIRKIILQKEGSLVRLMQRLLREKYYFFIVLRPKQKIYRAWGKVCIYFKSKCIFFSKKSAAETTQQVGLFHVEGWDESKFLTKLYLSSGVKVGRYKKIHS